MFKNWMTHSLLLIPKITQDIKYQTVKKKKASEDTDLTKEDITNQICPKLV